ncbi:MAG TPA: COX15/CtaA family protein [Acidisphaera sp.]|nr:COX15/CtaA family protein [Acidisphaera sp.]
MPFDLTDFPGASPEDRAAGRSSRRLVAAWLLGVAALIWAMVVLGGATRLTGSGLSIMEWDPIVGALPPLSQAEWERLFALYKQIPQYALLHAHTGFELADFRHIFRLEWAHRLLGRIIGAAFLLPMLVLWAGGRIERRLLPRLGLLFVLGGLQGAVGWFMVASGFFPDSTAVAPARLVIHLVLALTLFGAILWTALTVLRPSPRRDASASLYWLSRLALGAAALTIVAGGFVAGTHAGLTYTTFPLMDGQIVPEGYAALHPFVLNLTRNIATVQFDHRALATITAVLGLAAFVAGLLDPRRPAFAVTALGAVTLLQYALGVATLLNVVPVGLAVAHQGGAVAVLAAAILLAHATRNPLALKTAPIGDTSVGTPAKPASP